MLQKTITKVGGLMKWLITVWISIGWLTAHACEDAPRQYHKLNGYTHQYRVTGKGPLMFFPSPYWGVGSDLYLNTLAKHLSQKFTVVFYDVRGSGLSEGPSNIEGFKFEDYASDLEALRKHFRAPRVYLAGHSAGGQIIIDYAARYPDRVERLLVFDSVLFQGSESYTSYQQQWMQNVAVHQSWWHDFVRGSEALRGVNKETSPEELVDLLADVVQPHFYAYENYKTFVSQWRQDPEKRVNVLAYLAFAGGQLRPDLRPTARKVSAPTTIVVGAYDQATPVQEARLLHEAIHDSKLYVVSDAGHFPWIENPEGFWTFWDDIQPE